MQSTQLYHSSTATGMHVTCKELHAYITHWSTIIVGNSCKGHSKVMLCRK